MARILAAGDCCPSVPSDSVESFDAVPATLSQSPLGASGGFVALEGVYLGGTPIQDEHEGFQLSEDAIGTRVDADHRKPSAVEAVELCVERAYVRE